MPSSTTWWAQTPTNARWTAAGATLIGAALAVVSYFVWTSPDNPVSPISTINRVNVFAERVDRIVEERGELLGQVVELRTELAAVETDLAAARGEATDAEERLQQLERDAAPGREASPDRPSQPATSASGPDDQPADRPSDPAPEPTPGPTPITAPSKAEIVNPENEYFGMYTAQAPFNWSTLDDTASKIGYAPDSVGYFGGFDEAFRANAVTRSWERDMLPILTWEGRPIKAGNDVVVEPDYELKDVLSGQYDAYLTQYAKDIAATGLPLGIRLNHEMNGTWYPWTEQTSRGEPINGNSKGEYVQVWRYIHDIFEREGANEHVIWIWAPNIINNLPAAHRDVEFLRALYPGDEYVDWVGASGYLRPPYRAENDFSFDYTYGATLDQLRQIADKPIFLAEVGASETGGHKPGWVRSFFDGLADPANDDIVGFAWFSLAVTSYVEGERATNDWRIDSRADSLAAFREGVARPENDFGLIPV